MHGPPRDLPGGDHDRPYRFGHPTGYLNTWEQARLLVLRGRVLDGEFFDDGAWAGHAWTTHREPIPKEEF